LNELLSALGPLGVARTGVGVGAGRVGDGAAEVVAVGPAWAAVPELEHPVMRNAPSAIATKARILPGSLGRLYDAAVTSEGGGIEDEIYRGWEVYQGYLIKAIAPLDAAQLNIRAAPHLWSVRMLACHIVATRSGLFHWWMGEGDSDFADLGEWDEDHAPPDRPATEIVRGLEETWSMMKSRLERWTPADLTKEFTRPKPNRAGERSKHSRQWIIWHLLEHDSPWREISFSLGMHGVAGSTSSRCNQTGFGASNGQDMIGVVIDRGRRSWLGRPRAMRRRSRRSSSHCSTRHTGWQR
jgi:uncharacterized damage-inducible protein DinB